MYSIGNLITAEISYSIKLNQRIATCDKIEASPKLITIYKVIIIKLSTDTNLITTETEESRYA